MCDDVPKLCARGVRQLRLLIPLAAVATGCGSPGDAIFWNADEEYELFLKVTEQLPVRPQTNGASAKVSVNNTASGHNPCTQ